MKFSKNRILLPLIIFILGIFARPGFAQLDFNPSGPVSTLDMVEVEVLTKHQTLAAGDEAQFAIKMDIKDGWHLNAHNPPLDYLIGVNLEASPSNAAIISDIQYPIADKVKFAFADEVLDVYEGTVYILVKAKSSDNLEAGKYLLESELEVQACSDKVCLSPATTQLEFPLKIGQETVEVAEHQELFAQLAEREAEILAASEDNEIASLFDEKGFFWAFVGIFFIGLALNLTPCVYPMMSVTISLFGGQAGGDAKKENTFSTFTKALVYVMGIVFMYSVLGVVAAFTGGLFGSWLQSPWVLAGIGVLIFLLSLSMFGLYELQPPASLMQKLGKSQQATGYIGHFLSGLFVGIFAAPCIGPPIIALLAFVGAQGSAVFGFFSFFILALGLGIPYLILGTFSGLLNKMPKSGVWMVWVKKVFGIVLVGVALFYLALAFAPGYSIHAVLATTVVGGTYLGFIERSGNERTFFKWIKYATGIGAFVMAFLLFQNLQKEEITWQTYNADLIGQTETPVMLDFYADWCIPCIELDRKTFTDSRIIKETDSWTRMKVDLTHFDSEEAERLRKEYGVAGVPTIMFLDANGKEIPNTRVVGFLNARRFLKRIETVQNKFASNQ